MCGTFGEGALARRVGRGRILIQLVHPVRRGRASVELVALAIADRIVFVHEVAVRAVLVLRRNRVAVGEPLGRRQFLVLVNIITITSAGGHHECCMKKIFIGRFAYSGPAF